MDLLHSIATFFNRPDQVADSTFEEILAAIRNGEHCSICQEKLTFPVGVSPSGHLFDADCLESLGSTICPETGREMLYFDKVFENQGVIEVALVPKTPADLSPTRSVRSPSPVRSVDRTRSPSPVRSVSVKSPSPVRSVSVRSPSPISKEVQGNVDTGGVHGTEEKGLSEGQDSLYSPVPEGFESSGGNSPSRASPKRSLSPLAGKVGVTSPRSPIQEVTDPGTPLYHSPRISPVVKHLSPQKKLRTGNLEAKDPEQGPKNTSSKWNYHPYDDLEEIKLLKTIDERIWALVTNIHLIQGGKELLRPGSYFKATLKAISSLVQKELYRIVRDLEPDDLPDLLAKNENVGTVILYAMVLFLAIELLSREKSRSFSAERKFNEFFKSQRFQSWLNSGHLSSTHFDKKELARLFQRA